MPEQLRFDMAAVRSWERTASGGLRVLASITKAGVLTYRDPSGNEWREWRPPEEVFAEDSLATLRGAPVTDLHPSALVTPATWRDVSVGHVGDDVARDGIYVAASVLVQDASEIARIEAGERKEVSAGYACQVEDTPGVTPEGEPYDRVQRRIRYNHAALGPSGWGRAGADVSLRIDSAVEVVRDGAVAARADDNATAGTSSAAQEQLMKKKLKIRGREIEIRVDAEDGMAEAQGAVTELEKKADADATELAAVKAGLIDMVQKIAALEAKLAASASAEASEPNEAADEAAIPEAVLDAAIEKRSTLIESARKVLGASFDPKGKKASEIKRAVIAKQMPAVKLDSLSSDTVDGMFEAIVAVVPSTAANADQRNDALAAANADAIKGASNSNTTSETKTLADRLVERGKQPISGKAGG